MPTLHFISKFGGPEDYEAVLGPLTADDILIEADDFTLADCVVSLGVFKSKSQANKNSWAGKLPRGFKEWKIGKRVFYTYFPISGPYQED